MGCQAKQRFWELLFGLVPSVTFLHEPHWAACWLCPPGHPGIPLAPSAGENRDLVAPVMCWIQPQPRAAPLPCRRRGCLPATAPGLAPCWAQLGNAAGTAAGQGQQGSCGCSGIPGSGTELCSALHSCRAVFFPSWQQSQRHKTFSQAQRARQHSSWVGEWVQCVRVLVGFP